MLKCRLFIEFRVIPQPCEFLGCARAGVGKSIQKTRVRRQPRAPPNYDIWKTYHDNSVWLLLGRRETGIAERNILKRWPTVRTVRGVQIRYVCFLRIPLSWRRVPVGTSTTATVRRVGLSARCGSVPVPVLVPVRTGSWHQLTYRTVVRRGCGFWCPCGQRRFDYRCWLGSVRYLPYTVLAGVPGGMWNPGTLEPARTYKIRLPYAKVVPGTRYGTSYVRGTGTVLSSVSERGQAVGGWEQLPFLVANLSYGSRTRTCSSTRRRQGAWWNAATHIAHTAATPTNKIQKNKYRYRKIIMCRGGFRPPRRPYLVLRYNKYLLEDAGN
jgi:hypothetical protein